VGGREAKQGGACAKEVFAAAAQAASTTVEAAAPQKGACTPQELAGMSKAKRLEGSPAIHRWMDGASSRGAGREAGCPAAGAGRKGILRRVSSPVAATYARKLAS